LPGNVLSFRSDLSATIGNSSFFKFDNGFVSLWESGSGVFTITAIPEPATCVAAAGLVFLLLWPSTRFIRDAKSVLGWRHLVRQRLVMRRQ